MSVESIRLETISLRGGMQTRVDIDQGVVDEYVASMEAGVELPPVIVFFDGKKHWLVDGFHRWHAARKAKLEKFIGRDIAILCDVYEGTLEEARWFSYSVNQTHGLRRSNADKAKAVEAALRHPKGAKMSDRQIAEHVGVSNTFVGRIRKEKETDNSLSTVDSRTGADGRTIDTSNIGKQSKDDGEIVEVYEDEKAPEGYEYVEVAEKKYPHSDRFGFWLDHISGQLTGMRQLHETVADMVADDGWDKTLTSEYAQRVRRVHDELAKFCKEFKSKAGLDMTPHAPPAAEGEEFGSALDEAARLHDGIGRLLRRWPDDQGEVVAKVLTDCAKQLGKTNKKRPA